MKKYLLSFMVFALLIFALPMVALIGSDSKTASEQPLPDPYKIEAPQSYRLLLEESGETLEISPKEYIIGCLFASIPAGYNMEMLKAQAVAANTYGLLLYQNNTSADFDLTDNAETAQPFCTPSQAAELYGDEYEAMLSRLSEAAETGVKYALVYDKRLILPAYHSISAGKTESAYAVWGEDYPYLVPVESAADLQSPDFNGSAIFSVAAARGGFMTIYPDIELDKDVNLWFSEPVYSESGTLLSVRCGNKTISGVQIMKQFGLRSPAILIDLGGGGVTFFTKGYGYCVGMSIYGGNSLAKSGKTFSEILSYYYTGVEAVLLDGESENAST